MDTTELRQWLTELGAKGTQLDFDVVKGRATVKAGGFAFYAARADELRASLHKFIDAYQADIDSMDRAADAVKLVDVYGLITQSITLRATDKPGLQTRLSGMDFLTPLIDKRYRPKLQRENFRGEYAQYSMLKLMFEGNPRYGLLESKLAQLHAPTAARRTQVEIIDFVAQGLIGVDSRAAEYYGYLGRQARRGTSTYVPLAKYYHCTGAPSDTEVDLKGIAAFRKILSDGKIRPRSPKGGVYGAWVATKPLAEAYGDYAFALSVLVEAYNDIRFKSDEFAATPTLANHQGTPKFDVGFARDVVIDPQISVGPDKDPKLGYSTLAYLAVKDSEFDDFYSDFSASYDKRYGPVLGFEHQNQQPDYAVFKLSTAKVIASLTAQIQPPIIPAEWFKKGNRP